MLCYTTQCQVPYIATHKDVATKLTRSCLTHILVDNGHHKINLVMPHSLTHSHTHTLVNNGHNKVNFVNFVIKSKRKKRQGIKNDTLSHKVIPKKKAKKKP